MKEIILRNSFPSDENLETKKNDILINSIHMATILNCFPDKGKNKTDLF